MATWRFKFVSVAGWTCPATFADLRGDFVHAEASAAGKGQTIGD